VISPGWHSGESGGSNGSAAGGTGDNDNAGYGSGASGAGTGGYTDENKGADPKKAMGSYSCPGKSGAKGWKGMRQDK
jgi:hypothetical protein